MIEDRQPVLRPKRRLILATQSMQQLFRPPPLVVLSAESSSSCETAAYLVARLALGDACSSIPFSGLLWDKRTSVLDLKIENQDLEKFSVINCFAKFHGLGPADGAETSSSSNAAANAQRPFPQRYGTALPVPRNLPDRCAGTCTKTLESYKLEMQVKNRY
ncbi:hypothetical protein Acr_04g0001060 [Actinidia rufa]|uniref:Uncharacterized protein n=1 Tax=Actinidia rufa TaxID=165716 RepID=A0A7J0EFX5_9ERIC|nr:hypothetical protein Acr_04g0001060 [Actinidia rufa]